MVPEFRQRTPAASGDSSGETNHQPVRTETVAVRNYDRAETHTVTVRVLDADDVVVTRSRTVPPQTGVSIYDPVERGVYCVEARIEGECRASTPCLVGSGPEETPLVELGNGVVSVVEGVV